MPTYYVYDIGRTYIYLKKIVHKDQEIVFLMVKIKVILYVKSSSIRKINIKKSGLVPPRIELGLLDSESRVLIIIAWDRVEIKQKDKYLRTT